MLDPKKLLVGAGNVIVPQVASRDQTTAGFRHVRSVLDANRGRIPIAGVEGVIVGCYASMVEAAPPPPITFDDLVPPEGFRLVRNEPGDMIQIDDLIAWLTKVRNQYGNTCVYGRDICWGAIALNRSADDEEKSGV